MTETLAQETAVTIRKARPEDGRHIWQTVADSGRLDVNSAYCYIMLAAYFKDTCLVAELDGRIVGFVSAFIQPSDREVLFVWQIAVSRDYRKRGIADSLLSSLIALDRCREVRYIEATISPDNAASHRLFAGLADRLGTRRTVASGFAAELFPGSQHEAEQLVRIGPLGSQSNRTNTNKGES
ncbi:diaminobutyrate acetyltransferase [Paenibacillus athensensis]|uniref:L-2,4-diaminobutyric acid acetyltransferase n=1 Tax=Paenibacillus athensensis TaxID=1967502 RepID=A0A4Y8Q030_9BACL|nr:diaminobutyrate acetyltransferase [Paenibacillus athensensis]MCD1261088.1 diaminobutyrate acetyltransferase [Paenibacillus athensensis]